MCSSSTTTTLSEAYRDLPLHLHHIIPIDFNSVCSVPESHTWSESGDLSGNGLSVPLIDLRDPRVTQLTGHACEKWGVFQLMNHGIPLNVLKDAESEARRLFSLPARQKLKALRGPGGATGYGIARITPFFDKYMWHEGFTIMGASIFDHAKMLWPHTNNHAIFCDAMENYQKKMNILAKRLTKLIIKSMDISSSSSSEEEMNWPVGSSSRSALQLNSYPSCPEPNRAMGLAPHTDTSLITILHQSSITGLQIFKEETGWVPVKPVDGALVVNVGDFFHILSNARFTNVLHRVFVNQNWQRLSLAYFHCPPIDSNVVPIVKSGQVARYCSVTVKEFISLKAKSLEKALSCIKI